MVMMMITLVSRAAAALVLVLAAYSQVVLGHADGTVRTADDDPLQKFAAAAHRFLGNFVSELGSSVNSYPNCRHDIETVLREAGHGREWAMRFFDSMGKPGSGVLEGGVNFPGFFSECVATRSNDGGIGGKYCFSRIKFLPEQESPNQNQSNDVVSLWNFSVGVCVPTSCTQEEIDRAALSAASVLGEDARAETDECYTDIEKFTPDVPSCFVIWIFSVSVLLAVIGTALDVKLHEWFRQTNSCKTSTSTDSDMQCIDSTTTNSSTSSNSSTDSSSSSEELCKEKPTVDNKFVALLKSFSLVNNGRKILGPPSTEGAHLQALHGIRFLSMAWIIVGHTFFFAQKWLFFRNPDVMTALTKSILSQAFANGTFAVDTFFFLSGFLVAHTMFKRLKQTNGRFNILQFYLHRYLRMTPVMMMIIAFSSTFMKYLGSGPSWRQATVMYDDWCRENWWVNALYLQNFIHRDHMCLSHTWYSAVDMQFYLISPLIIYLCHRHPFGALVALLVPFLVTSICPVLYTYFYHLPAVPSDTVPLSVMNEYYASIYIKPYCRMGPYLVGITLAYVMYKHQSRLTMTRITKITGWIVAISVNVGIILSMARVFKSDPPTDDEAAFYNGFARTAWAITIAWITLVCSCGGSGPLHRLLSVRVIIPLSRLTYSAYLVHPVLMAMFYGTREGVFDFSLYWLIYLFIGNLVITYTVSFILSLLFEMPVMNIEKILRER